MTGGIPDGSTATGGAAAATTGNEMNVQAGTAASCLIAIAPTVVTLWVRAMLATAGRWSELK